MLDGGNLWDLVTRRAAATPHALLAVDENGRRLAFGEYREAAERAAAGLRALGVEAGTVVSWQLPTWLESLVLAGALARLGAVQNPILPIYRDREVGFMTRQAGSALFVVPSTWRGFDYEAMAKRVADDVASRTGRTLRVLACDRTLPDGEPATLPPPPSVPPSADDAPVRWIFYTSGTTAEPKGAQHTDSTIIVTARGMCDRLRFDDTSANSLLFPFTHVAGPIWLTSSMLTGGAHILLEAFDPALATEVLRREGVTCAGSGTVFHLAYLAAQRQTPDTPIFPAMRCATGGGAPKPPRLHYDLKREMGGAGILSGWGLTESPILTMATFGDPDEALAETEGRALPGVELRVVTPDGRVAGADEEGELRAKAPQMMRGYVDSALDAAAFDADGFFRTGDLGRVDGQGYVTITGRLKDVIIRKGENISAKEIEDLLFSHAGVADVAVVGLPDAASGELVCAVVVPADPAAPPGFEELTAHLRGQGLITRKLPERLEYADALPRNPAGKVVKSELRSRYEKPGGTP